MIDAIGAIFPYESPKPGGYRPYNYTGLGWIGVYQDAVSVIIDDASFIGLLQQAKKEPRALRMF